MKKLIIIFVAAFSYQTNAGIPTIDVANITQTTVTAIQSIKQVVELQNQVKQAIAAVEQAEQTYESLSGSYGLDALLNNSDNKKDRRYVPETFSEVLALFESTSQTEYDGVLDAAFDAKDELRVAENEEIFDDLDSDDAVRSKQHEINTLGAIAVSDASFARVTQLIDESEGLMDAIASTTDGKAAQDLQNRLTGQTHLLLAEMVRIQASQAATQARNQLNDEARHKEDQKRGKTQTFEEFFANQVNKNKN